MDKGKFREKVTSDLKKYHVPVAETVDKELARLRRVEAAAKAVNAAFLRGDGIMDVVIDNLSAALEEGV